jgi:hypothetical protein
MTIHVLPLHDKFAHVTNQQCTCQPLFCTDGLVIHRAHDLREAQERMGRADPARKWAVVEGEESRRHA